MVPSSPKVPCRTGKTTSMALPSGCLVGPGMGPGQQCRNALVQQLRPRRGVGIAGPQPPCHRAHVAAQQPVRIRGRQPAALLRDADRRDVEFFAINRASEPTPQTAAKPHARRCARQKECLREVFLPWVDCRSANSRPSFRRHQVRIQFNNKRALPPRSLAPCSLAPCFYRIFLPNAEHASSTARSAVRLCSSITGFTSTTSKLSIRP